MKYADGHEAPVVLAGIDYTEEVDDGAAFVESMGKEYESLYSQRPEDGDFEWNERDGIKRFYYN